MLDSDALVSNWRAMGKQAPNADVGAAVKADAYGVGAREVVARLSKAGCSDFFVAHWEEAKAIADLVPASQIAVLNGITGNDLSQIRKLGAIPVINTPTQVARWRESGGGLCHVMIDSGINRLGIGPEQLSGGLLDGMAIDILMSHLASADTDVPQNPAQLATFNQIANVTKANRRSLANSAGIMLGAAYHFDLCRPGLSLYGGFARPEMREIIRQVVFPQAQILQVRDLPSGAPVGYNATFTCPTDMRIATAAIGYADGYFRGFSGKGFCQFEGQSLPLIGRVSMDLVTIDVSAAKGLKEGDYVDMDFDLFNASNISGMSQYELLTGLGNRSQRVWK
jgi:alanine racemase